MDQPTQAANPKQQIVEAIKSATNVLVTVSRDPSVDQLAACIGLTLMLNKLGKHGTAVFSGAVPSTLEFLQPEKTIETNTDSLRDFIISLDRSKADKLRYKVEDEVVKIFITPYRTTLTSDDLQFSQGDFNVDVVVALGVDQREYLDEAIIAHGRILHDAKVIGISCGERQTDVGSINWHEPVASSLSEMLVSISESFQSGLLDAQMSTAYLTGIVAETDRFKNQKTTPKVMTMSAQLMAAGANQQLIASQLALPTNEPNPALEPSTPTEHIPIAERSPETTGDATTPETEQSESQAEPSAATTPELPAPVEEPGTLDVQDSQPGVEGDSVSLHKTEVPQPAHEEEAEPREAEIHIDEHGRLMDEEERRAREKVIEPLTMKTEQPRTDLSTYVFNEPQHSAAFTANTQLENTDKMVNPLTNDVDNQFEQNHQPILSHENEGVTPPPNEAPEVDDVVSVPKPLVTQEQDVPPKVSETPEQPKLDTAPELDNPPSGSSMSEPKIDEDAARQAVLQAVASSEPAVPSHNPVEALNAQPMPLDQPLIDQSAGAAAPPPVPPPLMPPPDLPLPGVDQTSKSS